MSGECKTSIWQVLKPSEWPKVPVWMSFSTLLELESCPRRWALSAAEYPGIWDRRGYPSPLHPVALEGMIVHLALQRITSAFAKRGCSSLADKRAIATLRELGGYTAIILDCLERTLARYEKNPRVVAALSGIRQRLTYRVPDLRSRVQRFLSRIRPESDTIHKEYDVCHQANPRRELSLGCHTEVELRADGLKWLGVVDLLTLSAGICEIRDFKTGIPKEEHEFQLRIYALLWILDHVSNPTGRLADKLVISYDEGDIEIAPPNEKDIRILEDELRERTETALAALAHNPPEARLARKNCESCIVRHLCDDYWEWNSWDNQNEGLFKNQFVDLQVRLTGSHGPHSWDGVIESPPYPNAMKPILLRTGSLSLNLRLGQRVRVLDVLISMSNEESIEDKSAPVVATMGANSEMFLLP